MRASFVEAAPRTPRWRAVEGYLEGVIPLASAKHANKEGAVQAAVSVFSADDRVMVDREVALSFKDTSTKTRIFEEITAPYRRAHPVLWSRRRSGQPGRGEVVPVPLDCLSGRGADLGAHRTG